MVTGFVKTGEETSLDLESGLDLLLLGRESWVQPLVLETLGPLFLGGRPGLRLVGATLEVIDELLFRWEGLEGSLSSSLSMIFFSLLLFRIYISSEFS